MEAPREEKAAAPGAALQAALREEPRVETEVEPRAASRAALPEEPRAALPVAPRVEARAVRPAAPRGAATQGRPCSCAPCLPRATPEPSRGRASSRPRRAR